jgi:hypothetical protein
MDIKEMGEKSVNWICLAENSDHWWAFVNSVMNLWFPKGTLIHGARFLHSETWWLLGICNYSIYVISFKHLYSLVLGETVGCNSYMCPIVCCTC